jgi:hypothetical protein
MRRFTMRGFLCFVLIVAAVFFSGCLVMSLHPFFTDNNSVFEKQLVGTWVHTTGKTTLTFRQFGANAYRVTYLQQEISTPSGGKKQSGEPGEFEAHVGRINGALFVDLYPDKNSWDRLKNDLLAVHLAPTHTIMKIVLNGDRFTCAGLDHDWLQDLVTKNSAAIAHENVEGAVVLTAPTDALQKFLTKHSSDPKAFPDGEEFQRQR